MRNRSQGVPPMRVQGKIQDLGATQMPEEEFTLIQVTSKTVNNGFLIQREFAGNMGHGKVKVDVYVTRSQLSTAMDEAAENLADPEEPMIDTDHPGDPEEPGTPVH